MLDSVEIEAESRGKLKILARQSYYRGDIRGKAAWSSKIREGVRKNGVTTGIKKWPNGRIPYVISSQYNERERAVLARAFQEYHTKTCIRFSPRTAYDKDYLYIGKIDGCFSDVGRAGGRQELSLDDGCLQYDTAIHELMHSVGFYHEHERWDRDKYITILWHNIDRDKHNLEAYDQFGRVDLSESSYYGQPYDYYSIMHYDSLAFSKNGFETLVAKRPEMTPIIGSAIDFSNTDLIKINKMYSCPSLKLSQTLQLGNVGSSHLKLWSLTTTQAPPPSLPLVVDASECRDKTNLCWRWLDRCHSFFFEKIMREFCARSCGFCTPGVKQAIKSVQLPQLALGLAPALPQLQYQRPLYQRFG
uniref:Metalloendopeptidase n=1 Tax=Syphacia muris TaxID=451379 RepID=A0A0N5AQI8_9BILA